MILLVKIFSLSFQDGQRLGTSDGIYRKHRYFKCEQETGIFVPLHRIRKTNKQHHPSRKPKADSITGPYMHYGDYHFSGLKIGTRVVWMSDNGPERGEVKWIGILPDSRKVDDYTVGVEFVSIFTSAVFRENSKYCYIYSCGVVFKVVSKLFVISLITEDIYLQFVFIIHREIHNIKGDNSKCI